MPGVRPGRGGVVFWDGQLVDDARLVVSLARTAAAFGARVLTGATVTEVDGDRVALTVDGTALTVRAGVVVNAAGVWAQRLAPGVALVPSRGSHLVLPASLLGSPTAALTVPLPGSRSRYVFVLPQGRGLVHRYGTEAPVVAALGVEPVVEGRPETVGELPFAVRAEGARSVADLLDRRTRIGLVTAERARAEPVAEAVLAEP